MHLKNGEWAIHSFVFIEQREIPYMEETPHTWRQGPALSPASEPILGNLDQKEDHRESLGGPQEAAVSLPLPH